MTGRLLLAALALLAAACSNTEGKPRPVDPPSCWPHCRPEAVAPW